MPIPLNHTGAGTVTLKAPASGTVTFTLPAADGANGQVVQTNGSGVLSFVTAGGGGGGGSVATLSDVQLSTLAEGDILRYNTLASKWQNTNLSLSITPTITLTAASTVYSVLQGTITNYASYSALASVYIDVINSGGTIVVANSSVNSTRDITTGAITVTVSALAAATYTVRVKVQELGSIISDTATASFTKLDPSFRYWRVNNFTGVGSGAYLRNWALYSGSARTGTKYPTNMTSNTAPSPFVASGRYRYSAAYEFFYAFDSDTGGSGAWTLGSSSNATDYFQIDLGAATTIKSHQVSWNTSYFPTQFWIEASSTGSFTGEQITIAKLPSPTGGIINVG